jgi:hypothetical protein
VTRRDERAARDIPAALDGYATAVAIGQTAVALLRERGAEAPGPPRDALRTELKGSLDANLGQNIETLWPRSRLHQLNAWRRAYRKRRLDSWAWLEHHGPDHPAGVERIMIHLSSKKSRQGGPTDKVRMYYRTCHYCRRVLLGKMTVNNPSHRSLGLGSYAIRHVMEEIPGYTWYTSVQRDSAVSYWTLMAERTGAGFIGPDRGLDIRCEHIQTVKDSEYRSPCDGLVLGKCTA